MRTIKICMALVGMILLGSCAVTDVESTRDFSQYRTFAFGEPVVDVSDPKYTSGLIHARIRSAVRDEFRKRGLEYASEEPDLVVTCKTYTEDKTASNSSPYMMSPFGFYPYRYWYWGYHPGFYGWGYPYGGRPYDYTQGTLIIDINDRRTGEHIWRGMVSGNVNNIPALQKQLDKAVKAIIRKYPVAPVEERVKVPSTDDVS